MPENPDYDPAPFSTDSVALPAGVEGLIELLAANTHDHWAKQRQAEGWTRGDQRDDVLKLHPGLVPYEELPESEKEYDRITARESLQAIVALGYKIEPPSAATPPVTPPVSAPVSPSISAPAVAPLGDPDDPFRVSHPTLMRHLDGDHPKRILSLDGGGIRGVLTSGFLERLEMLLAKRLVKSGKLASTDEFRLCQYFDLIGGTSTGAIIASLLAIGWKAADVKKLYLELGADIFKKDMGLWGLIREAKRFKKAALEVHLAREFGNRTLGSADIQTGLCVVAKRADTRSTWPVINHPRGEFYNFNSPLSLWRLIRASSAAPTFFEPQLLPTGETDARGRLVQGAFVDGAVSMANNPALQCFLIAVLKGFNFRWPVGEEKLLIVSLGTGMAKVKLAAKDVVNNRIYDWAREIPQMLMDDAGWQNQLLLQALGRSANPWEINMEVGDCSEDTIAGNPLFHYTRYDVLLEHDYLEKELGLADLAPKAESLRDLSAAKNRFDLQRIGEVAAKKQIPSDPAEFARHIPEVFDTVIR
ncbi:MAG: hypothetical protein ACI8UO_003518 [Verrucomicrobiales bacterium]|jgi:hypothetical protein